MSKYLSFIACFILLNSCLYKFNGISIPPEINTFYIDNFTNNAPNAPVEIDVQFSEALRTKIRNESKLKLKDVDPDITFAGEITNYRVTAESPQEGNTVALNKIQIDVQVRYTNNRTEKDKYSKVYSFFKTFPGDQDLQAVQANLNKEIINQITENIFNETFTSW